MPDLVSLDSNVIIDVIQETPGVFKPLRRLFRSAEAGDTLIIISSVVRAEIMCLKELSARGMRQEIQNNLISAWFRNDYIEERTAGRTICDRAAELRRHVALNVSGKKLTPVDSIVLATAEAMKVSQLISLDTGNSGDKQIGLVGIEAHFGLDFPSVCLPEDYKGQTEIDLDD